MEKKFDNQRQANQIRRDESRGCRSPQILLLIYIIQTIAIYIAILYYERILILYVINSNIVQFVFIVLLQKIKIVFIVSVK